MFQSVCVEVLLVVHSEVTEPTCEVLFLLPQLVINLYIHCSPEAYNVSRHFCEGGLELCEMPEDLLLLNLVLRSWTIH